MSQVDMETQYERKVILQNQIGVTSNMEFLFPIYYIFLIKFIKMFH